MTDMIFAPAAAVSPSEAPPPGILSCAPPPDVRSCAPPPDVLSSAPPRDIIRDALMESRQRWQQFVGLATDLAFETDAKGRFVFIMPETAFGWPAGSLIGQPSEFLIGDDGTGAIFNPFRPAMEVRRHRTWLRCRDGRLAMMTVSATPLYDTAGAIMGSRGIGIDMTDSDAQTAQIAGRLRRGEVLDHILARVGQETGADCMMDAALWALIHALGAEGSAVIGGLSEAAPIDVLHECGPGAAAILPAATRLVAQQKAEPGHTTNRDGRFVLAVGCQTRFGVNAGLAIWRNANARPWDQEDTLLAGSAVRIVRMILEFEAVQREMAYQARTDPLTGLLNRRAFMEEMRRQVSRLDRESEAGTLMYVDLDAFKAVNDRLGHATGDQILVHVADLLRRLVRPSDLIARLGGDEFAVWLSGADHMTAAERADHLCKSAPIEMQALLPETFAGLGLSVGIAMRRAGSRESIEDLTRRADMAMYEVKRTGRRHWRVSLLDGD
jgi:diguanylate cyclase (GGDEF)-like protein/PAS domain S-box-containing protein